MKALHKRHSGWFIAAFAAMSLSAFAAPERWDAPGGEFSVVFSNHIETGRTDGAPSEGGDHVDWALSELKYGAERVEVVAQHRDSPITKKDAYEKGDFWAKGMGISNITFSFDDSNSEDTKLVIKGLRQFGEVPSTVMGVMHWGRKSFMVVWFAEKSTVFPSTEALHYIDSVKQNPSK